MINYAFGLLASISCGMNGENHFVKSFQL